MRISVRFFTLLREIVGRKEEILEFQTGERITVRSVLKCLSEKHGKAFDDYVYDIKTGEIKGYLQVLLNGRSIASFECLETELSGGDMLAIIPPVGGG